MTHIPKNQTQEHSERTWASVIGNFLSSLAFCSFIILAIAVVSFLAVMLLSSAGLLGWAGMAYGMIGATALSVTAGLAALFWLIWNASEDVAHKTQSRN